MQKAVAREIAARIWGDIEMVGRPMDSELVEGIAQLLTTVGTKTVAKTKETIRRFANLAVFNLNTDLMLAQISEKGKLFDPLLMQFSDEEIEMLTNVLTKVTYAMLVNRKDEE